MAPVATGAKRRLEELAELAAAAASKLEESSSASASASTAMVASTAVAEEALRQAEAEGLTLLRSASSTGYQGVTFDSNGKARPYQARARRGGKSVSLGYFATAEEAALCYARSPEGQEAAAALAPPMTADEALRQAEAEGLTLLQSESGSSGYKGVAFNSRGKAKPYRALVWRRGQQVFLGCYATAEEAALCVARTPEGRKAAAAPLELPPMTAEEALRQAEAEGLTLPRSEASNTGYRCVTWKHGEKSSRSRPYLARVWRDGKEVTIGCFATAEEAALCYAQTPEGREAAAAPPEPTPLTAEEALRQAEAEGLTLERSETSITGYKGVYNTNKINHSSSKPYCARVARGSKTVHLGQFVTAEEAALVVARTPEGQASAAPPEPSMTAEEALHLAEAEGLTLHRSEKSSTGFKGVTSSGSKNKPYKAERTHGSRLSLGWFVTAEEAALELARDSAAPPGAKRRFEDRSRRPDGVPRKRPRARRR